MNTPSGLSALTVPELARMFHTAEDANDDVTVAAVQDALDPKQKRHPETDMQTLFQLHYRLQWRNGY